MKKEWCHLFEKFSDASLSDEEQRALVDLYENSLAFRVFWQQAGIQVGLVNTLKPVGDLQAFLSSALFIEQKVKQKQKKPLISLLIKVAAIVLFSLIPFYVFMVKDSLPLISHTNSNLSRYDFLFARTVRLGDELAVLDFEEGRVSVKGPARLKLNFDGSIQVISGSFHFVTEEGKDMKIITEQKTYVDIGTEFGLKVSKDLSEVHVFDGLVDVSGEVVVKKGGALKSDLESSLDIPISRKGFYNSAQLQGLLQARGNYERQIKRFEESPEVFEVFDLTKLAESQSSLRGLKESSLEIDLSFGSTKEGPYPYSKVPYISRNGEILELKIPEEIQEDYSIYVRYFYEEYSPQGSVIFSNESNNLKMKQVMTWFKKMYGKNGYMDEGFWKFRGLLFSKGRVYSSLSNLTDGTSRSLLPKSYSNSFILGNSKEYGLNFHGRIAQVVVFKSSDIKLLKSLFDKMN